MMRMEEALQTRKSNNGDLNRSSEWRALKKEKEKEKGPRRRQRRIHRKSDLPHDVGLGSMPEDRCCRHGRTDKNQDQTEKKARHSRIIFESAGRALARNTVQNKMDS